MWQVAWAHPMFGNVLASCSYDRKVIVWKEENGSWDKMYEYTGHESSGQDAATCCRRRRCCSSTPKRLLSRSAPEPF